MSYSLTLIRFTGCCHGCYIRTRPLPTWFSIPRHARSFRICHTPVPRILRCTNYSTKVGTWITCKSKHHTAEKNHLYWPCQENDAPPGRSVPTVQTQFGHLRGWDSGGGAFSKSYVHPFLKVSLRERHLGVLNSYQVEIRLPCSVKIREGPTSLEDGHYLLLEHREGGHTTKQGFGHW